MSTLHYGTLKTMSDFIMSDGAFFRFEMGIRITNETVIPKPMRAAYKQRKQDQAMFVLDSTASMLETEVDEYGLTLTTTFGGIIQDCFFPVDTILYIKDAYDGTGVGFVRNVDVPAGSVVPAAEHSVDRATVDNTESGPVVSAPVKERPNLALHINPKEIVTTPPIGDLKLVTD